jgi:predicted RNA-binding protein (virulence factor B family)
MIKPGYIYNFEVAYVDKDHYKLLHDSSRERIKLEKNADNLNLKVGYKVRAFVYLDKQRNLTATTKIPNIKLGEIASLKVVNIIGSGAFLDWGLSSDLFWPTEEQPHPIKQGKAYPVVLISPSEDQLIATGNIYNYLEPSEKHQEEEMVSGTVYDFSDQWGVFVAVFWANSPK